MKSICGFVFVVVMLANSLASGASILVGNFVDTNFVDAEGVATDSTYVAKIGFLSEGVTLTGTDDYGSILPNWTNAADIVFSNGDVENSDGYFSGRAEFADAAGLAGKAVYLWVTDGAGNNAIVRNNTTLFLADSAVPNENSAPALESAALSSQVWEVIFGTYDSEAPNLFGGGSIILNNAIPEPSFAILSAFGALGFLYRRRR